MRIPYVRRPLPWRSALIAIGAVFLLARPAQAQDVIPPDVSTNAPSSTTAASISVTITWCDPKDDPLVRQSGLNAGSRQILINGVNVTSSFSYSSTVISWCQVAARSTGTIPLVVGTNTLQASINDNAGNHGAGGATITRTAPVTRFPAIVDVARNPGDVRDPGKCVQDCFEKVFTYAMPGYVSRDVERGVTLVYRSGQAHPVGTVMLSARDTSPSRALKFSLKLQHPDGSFVTFLNGRTELFFENNSTNGASIVGQFAANGGVTRRVNYTAVVTSYWSDGSTVASAPTPVLIVNEESSPYGAGVGIAGIQRLYVNPDGGVIVTDGSGGASYFAGSCSVSTPCSYTTPSGDFSTLSTDGSGYYVRRYPDGTVVLFGFNGYHARTTDRFGSITNYGYVWNADYSVYALSSITDPAGQYINLWYRDAGSTYGGYYKTGGLGAIISWLGRTASFGIDPSNNLLHWMDVDGVYHGIAAYDAAHRMYQVADRNNGVWNFTYAINGTLSQVQAPLADLGGGVSARPTTNIIGPGVNVANALQAAPDTPVPYALDQRASITNPRGYATYYLVNRFGSMLAMTNALGQQTSATYNADGLPIQIIPVDGPASTFTWDGPRKTREVHGSSDVNFGYELTFNQPNHIWGTTTEQWLTYDTSKPGYPLLTVRAGTTPVDSATRFVFTPDGRIQSQTDALGHGTTWTYAPSGFQNVTETRSVTAVGEKKTSFAYDSLGRTYAVTDPTGATSQTNYNVRNLVTSTLGPRSELTRIYYDALGNDTLVVDARNQSYRFGRNVLGWPLTQSDPNGAIERFAYNPNGAVSSYTNRRGQTITTAYDEVDRVQSRYQQTEGQTTTYTYDLVNQRTIVQNGVSMDNLTLNANAQLAEQITVRNGFVRSVRADYDGNGRRSGLNVLKEGAATTDSVSYRFGDASQLTWIHGPFGQSTNIGYNRDYQPQTITFATGLIATNSYSSTHMLTGTSFNTAGIDLTFGLSYSRDSLGRVREVQERQFKTRRFTYDGAGELTSYADIHPYPTSCHFEPDYGRVCNPGGEDYLGGRSYGYDIVGNPTDAGVTTAWGNRMTVIGGDSVVYDADGNITRRYRVGAPSTFDQTLTWNSLGQLAQVSTTRDGATSTLQFAYDGLGRRAQKTVVGGSVVNYIWDGDQLVMETDAAGNTQRFYTYYGGTDQLHSVVSGGQTYYAAADAAGNVIGMINPGNTVSPYMYQPFGTIDLNDQVTPNSLRWKGLQYDAESGLYYVRARYYAPDLGRFVSEDPIGLAGGINPYTFAGNDPVNGSDPSGLVPCWGCLTNITIIASGSWPDVTREWFNNFARGGGPTVAGLFDNGAPGDPGPGSQQRQRKEKPKPMGKNCKPGGFCLADYLRPPKPLNPAAGRCMIQEAGNALGEAVGGAAAVFGANYALGRPVRLQVPSLKDVFNIFVEDGGAVKTGAAEAAGGAGAVAGALVWRCRESIF
jgi:RHS repeat-associated protein